MNGNFSVWQTVKSCYAHEQCVLANEQWSRLLNNMVGGISVKGSILQPRTAVDPCLTRLINSGDMSVDCGTVSDSSGDKRSSDLTACRRVLTPWKSEDRRYSPGLMGLDEEIAEFFDYITPLPEEDWMRRDVVLRITQLITELWPAAKVEVFGSYATGLYLPTSDIDVVVMYWEVDAQTPDVMQKALMTLEKQLINKGAYDDVKVIRTSLPIVKFTDRETAIKVDVGFNVTSGIQSAGFIKEKLLEFQHLKCLVFVLKQFLVYHNLLESFNGGISSYCLILLIVSYFQLNCGDEENLSYGQHLIRFLELYGCHFNYLRTGIRIRDGGSYFPKNDRQDGESENRYQFSLLYIEDPLNHDNDVGKGCYGAMKVRDAFANAYRDLRDAVLPQYRVIQSNCSTFLGRILGVPYEIVQYRRVISQRHAGLSNTVICPSTDDRLFLSSGVPPAADDRSDCGSVSSQTSNVSSLTKSSQCRSQSTGSGAVSDNESDANSDNTKPPVGQQHNADYSWCQQQQSLHQLSTSESVTSSHGKLAINVARSPSVFTAPSTEPPLAAVRLPRPSTLSIEEHPAAQKQCSVVVSMVTTAAPERVLGYSSIPSSCVTTTISTHTRQLPLVTTASRPGHSTHVMRGTNVHLQRGNTVISQGSSKTTVLTSGRSPNSNERFHRTNSISGAGRYTDNNSNVNCANAR